MTHGNGIPLEKCLSRHVYRVDSRNLLAAVYTGVNGGFIGIRTKFGDRYLFTEYHYDNGPPYGTVTPLEDLGIVPGDIEVKERNQTVDSITGRPVRFDGIREHGGRGWVFIDTNEPSQDIRPTSSTYKPLMQFLEAIESGL